MKELFKKLGVWLNTIQKDNERKQYKPGDEITMFIACDVRRDVKVISVDRIEEGVITCQIKTNNLLYNSKGFTEKQEYGQPVVVKISELWNWTGQSWGGLPNGKSIVEEIHDEAVASEEHIV